MKDTVVEVCVCMIDGYARRAGAHSRIYESSHGVSAPWPGARAYSIRWVELTRDTLFNFIYSA